MGRLGWLVAWIVVGVVALSLRLPDLASRPFHTDEATNAFLQDALFKGRYHYLGHDHHGPVLYYAAALLLRPLGLTTLAQWDETHLRAVSATAGVLLCFTPLLFRRWLGPAGALVAGGLLATAAPLVYFSGIFIHETLLVLWLALFCTAFWHTRDSGRKRWAVGAGIAAGLALGTKETAAVMLPVIAACAWSGSGRPAREQGLLAGLALAACLATVAAFYSNFGRHPGDAWALFRAAGLQVNRGTGDEHVYPWWHYAAEFLLPGRLGAPWSGWVLTGGALAAVFLGRREPFVLRTGLALALLTLFFSVLPYKTPWLTLSGWAAAAWLCGWAATFLLSRFPCGGALLPLALIGLLAWESRAKTGVNGVAEGNPLAYSPSSPDLARLGAAVSKAAVAHPDQQNLLIQVVARDYWPLPWVLRRYPQTGYWTDPTLIYPEALALLGPETAALQPDRADFQSFALRPGVFIFLRQPRR